MTAEPALLVIVFGAHRFDHTKAGRGVVPEQPEGGDLDVDVPAVDADVDAPEVDAEAPDVDVEGGDIDIEEGDAEADAGAGG